MNFENEIEHKILVTYVIAKVSEYLGKTIYDAWGRTVSKSQMLRDFVSEYKWAHLDMETFDAMNRENFFNNIEL